MSPATSFLEPDRDPPPFPAGEPYEWNLCPRRTPPMGWEFLGATATAVAWVLPCPACGRGWVGLRSDGEPYGYELAYDLGCSRNCGPEEVAWAHGFQKGDLPPPEPDERSRRYALAAARGAINDLAKVPANGAAAKAFARAAFRVGQAVALGGLDLVGTSRALVNAGTSLGLPLDETVAIARQRVLAGAAVPLRSPR